jgi:hypothetical protein
MTEPTESVFPQFVPAGLRVEATWPEGSSPESMVVEINDQPVTAELVNHVITALANATDVDPELVTASITDRPILDGANQ